MSDIFFCMRRRKTITGAGGIITTLSCKRAGLPTVESYSGGALNGISTETIYDSLMRKQSISAKRAGVAIGAAINYGYDNASRINSVDDGANTAKYGYVADSSLLDSTTFTSGVNQRLVTKRVFDSLNRLRSIQSSPSTGTPIRFDYQYNSANQRERVYLEDGSYWDYRYDSMGQLRTGRRYWKDGKPVAGQQFEYGFDDIGNRLSAKSGGDQNGQNLRLSSYDYGANLLNQPQKRTVPGSIDVTGVAPVAGTLTVNGVAPDHRRGEYFWRSLPVANGSAAVQQNVSVKLSTTTSGNVFVPQSPESYTYDDDGNLTSDGRWKYSWDAENRLVGMLDISKTGTEGQKLVFEYDFNSRRISKTVTGGGSASTKTVYVYDGWNLIAELDGTTFAAKRTYAWGLDLSGNLTGAGGVGGLLWVNVAGNGTHYVSYDGNGNVIGLNSATDGSNTARYEYGPFGEPIRVTGTRSADNPIRFSSKYTDPESGLVYYGYRFYNAVTGRWINRDPIGERGGLNLHAFNYNDEVNAADLLGLTIKCTCPEAYFKKNGITGEMLDSSGDVFSAKKGAVGPNSEDGLILWRMLVTKHLFTAKNLSVEELKRHVASRQRIVSNALKANFIFGTGQKQNWEGFRKDPQSFFDRLNNGSTTIACAALSRIIFETGNNFGKDNNGVWAEGHRNHDSVWIPGDWGYIRNVAFVSGSWDLGLEGENVFHVGFDGQDEQFWGHFESGLHSALSEKQWFNEVRLWNDGKGSPVWRNDIQYSTTGLQQ